MDGLLIMLKNLKEKAKIFGVKYQIQQTVVYLGA